jgi:hypothetical protein
VPPAGYWGLDLKVIIMRLHGIAAHIGTGLLLVPMGIALRFETTDRIGGIG